MITTTWSESCFNMIFLWQFSFINRMLDSACSHTLSFYLTVFLLCRFIISLCICAQRLYINPLKYSLLEDFSWLPWKPVTSEEYQPFTDVVKVTVKHGVCVDPLLLFFFIVVITTA